MTATIEHPPHVRIVNGRWERVETTPEPQPDADDHIVVIPVNVPVTPKPTRPLPAPPADAKPFVLTASWKKRRSTKISKVTKAGKLYDAIHRAWRAGVIGDFSYGMDITAADDTITWSVDGHTWAKDDLQGVTEWLDMCMSHAGVVSAEWGESWCGYRSLVVTRANGSVSVDEYDPARAS